MAQMTSSLHWNTGANTREAGLGKSQQLDEEVRKRLASHTTETYDDEEKRL